MGAWLQARAGAGAATACCRPKSVRARGLLPTRSRSQRLIRDHDANRVDGTDRLLALMNLEIWCRVYLDAHARRAAELCADRRCKELELAA